MWIAMNKNSLSIFFILLLIEGFALTDANAQEQKTLKDAFKDKFLVGAALKESQFSGKDERGTAIIRTQFNSISPENVLKWEYVHPQPDKYNFEASDKYVAFGEQNNMFIVGHTLVWHSQTPKWVFKDANGKDLSKEKLIERMHDHIATVIGRYKGRIKGWDVVNEAVEDDGSLRKSLWLKIIGKEYLVKAYQFAHEADPQAELYYNDFSVENISKRKGVIALVKELQSQGIHLTGIGIQGHYLMDWPRTGLLDSTITDFAHLGVKVMITELDIDILPQLERTASAEISRRFQYSEKTDPYKKCLPDSIQQALAQRYVDLFAVLKKNSDKVTRVTFWGVTDGDSWLNTFPIVGRTNYPLLFNRSGMTKPAFDAVIKTSGKYN
jgi:endo-1,4-beta-xylanase